MECPKCGRIIDEGDTYCCACQSTWTKWQQDENADLARKLAAEVREKFLLDGENQRLTIELDKARGEIERLKDYRNKYFEVVLDNLLEFKEEYPDLWQELLKESSEKVQRLMVLLEDK